MEMQPFTRRDFLKIVSAAGGALAGCPLLAGCVPGPVPVSPPAASPPQQATGTSAVPPASSETATVAALSDTPAPTSTPDPTATPVPIADSLPPVTAAGATQPLPAPRLDGGALLMQALQARHSTRSFRRDEISLQLLSDLLWAAFGVNRAQTGGRTAPSAYDVRDIDIYLAAAQGLFRYQPAGHDLLALSPDDLRSFTGTQSFVASAPLNLVYVSDYRRMAAFSDDRERWSWAHSGCIAQNVYLACASLGLATVVRSTLDRNQLAARAGLAADQHITLAQTVGFPA